MSLLLLFGDPLHRELLNTADRLLSQQEPAAALVTAHIACEIYSEQIISLAFRKRGITDLGTAVRKFFSGNHLANVRIRKVYVALTGDNIHEQPFWQAFSASWDLRNDVVHKGTRVAPDQGRDACEIARMFVAHMDAIAKSLT
jgi:hypothetical protein